MGKKMKGAGTGKPMSPDEFAEFLARLDEKDEGSATLTSVTERSAPHVKRNEMQEINESRRIPQCEREKVKKLNELLQSKYPVRTKRYTEIADQMDLKVDRVRYIIEGSRSKK